MSIDANAFTRAPKFKIVLTYLDAIPMQLSDLRVRYYFNHNGVTEPVIALDTQATFDPGGSQVDISSKVSWMVHRQPLGPLDHNGHKSDSYLEITFSSPASLSAGGKLELTQDIVAGSAEVSFDQPSHYSFLNGSGANQAITVYSGGQRLWGVEPPMSELPECAFAGGVHFGGPAVTVAGEALSAEVDEAVTFTGGTSYANASAKALPTTDVATTRLLTTGRTLSSADTAVWAVPNGKYWAYAWLSSAASTDTGTLSIQDNPADKFIGIQQNSSAGWALLGPYPIQVSDQTLTLAVTGTVNVAGLKLYQAQ